MQTWRWPQTRRGILVRSRLWLSSSCPTWPVSCCRQLEPVGDNRSAQSTVRTDGPSFHIRPQEVDAKLRAAKTNDQAMSTLSRGEEAALRRATCSFDCLHDVACMRSSGSCASTLTSNHSIARPRRHDGAVSAELLHVCMHALSNAGWRMCACAGRVRVGVSLKTCACWRCGPNVEAAAR